jgi:hypothetical protein
LLNILAREFVDSGFDQKHLIRAICNSQAYQRTSRPVAANEADTELFSHMAVKVLRPETFYDSLMLFLLPAGGKSSENRDQFTQFFTPQDDDPSPTEYSQGIPQLLKLLNARQFNSGAPVVDRLATSRAPAEKAIEELYLTVLSRRPTAKEVELMSAYLAKQRDAKTGYGGVLWILVNSSEFALNH